MSDFKGAALAPEETSLVSLHGHVVSPLIQDRLILRLQTNLHPKGGRFNLGEAERPFMIPFSGY